jgi:hypothetical protein
MAMFNDIVIFPGGKMARGKNYYRTPARKSVFCIRCYKPSFTLKGCVRVVVVNATFNNISVISWRSVLLAEETGVPRENYPLAASH